MIQMIQGSNAPGLYPKEMFPDDPANVEIIDTGTERRMVGGQICAERTILLMYEEKTHTFVGDELATRLAEGWNPSKSRDLPYLLSDLGNIARGMQDIASVEDAIGIRSYFDAEIEPHKFIIARIQELGQQNEFAQYINLHHDVSELRRRVESSTTDTQQMQEIDIFADMYNEYVAPVAQSVMEIAGKSASGLVGSAQAAIANVQSSATNYAVARVNDVAMGVFAKYIVPAAKIASVGFLAWWALNRLTIRENPLLMAVNPGKEDELFNHARRKMPSLSRREFSKSLKSFYAQHHRYPEPNEMTLVPSPRWMDGVPVTEVGKVKEIIYDPPQGSRKKPHKWKHAMANTTLVAPPEGKPLILVGDTYLDNWDGWLKK